MKNALKISLLSVIAVLVSWLCACAAAPAGGADEQITEKEIRATVEKLVSFGTRHAKNPKALEAAAYLKERLREIGFRVSYDVFTKDGVEMRNVIGVRVGAKKDSDRVILLGAHYDSIAGRPSDPAPGADDDASGVAAVLAAARALSSSRLDSELRVVFFTAEEIGLLGSKHYVSETMRDERRQVIALVADYIGTDMGAGDGTMILHNRASTALMRTVSSAAAAHVPDLHIWPMRSEMFRSFGDYKVFWDAGRPAVMLVREYNAASEKKEVYHTQNDLPDRMRFGQVVKVSRLIYFSALALDASD